MLAILASVVLLASISCVTAMLKEVIRVDVKAGTGNLKTNIGSSKVLKCCEVHDGGCSAED